jgi:hypothetical protein
MMAEGEALMILAAALPTGMRTAAVAVAAATRTTVLLPRSTLGAAAAAARLVMVAEVVDIAIHMEAVAVEVTGNSASSLCLALHVLIFFIESVVEAAEAAEALIRAVMALEVTAVVVVAVAVVILMAVAVALRMIVQVH